MRRQVGQLPHIRVRRRHEDLSAFKANFISPSTWLIRLRRCARSLAPSYKRLSARAPRIMQRAPWDHKPGHRGHRSSYLSHSPAQPSAMSQEKEKPAATALVQSASTASDPESGFDASTAASVQHDGAKSETAIATDHSSIIPDGGLEAWSVVAGGWLIMFATFGYMNCTFSS
jgi:hypothetical protein